MYKYGKFAKYLTNFANKETHSVLYVRDFINVLLDYGRKESNRNEGINKQLQRVISIADENVDKCLNGRGKDMLLRRMDEVDCLGTCISVIRK